MRLGRTKAGAPASICNGVLQAEGMRRRVQVVAGLVALAGLALPAAAQRARHMAPAGTRIVRVSQPLNVTTARAADIVDSIGIPSSASVSALINGGFPASGFGFDFTHFAAVNRNLGIRALIDPVTQLQLSLARQLRREAAVFPVALPTIINNNVNQIFLTLPPPVVIIEQPQVIEVPVERGDPPRASNEPAAPPAPELGELVFIRKDGSLVFAVGYSVVNERIIYVTREGIRRSFSLSDLDAESTRLMNEERGTSLRLPV